jgi:hypothetical protein
MNQKATRVGKKRLSMVRAARTALDERTGKSPEVAKKLATLPPGKISAKEAREIIESYGLRNVLYEVPTFNYEKLDKIRQRDARYAVRRRVAARMVTKGMKYQRVDELPQTLSKKVIFDIREMFVHVKPKYRSQLHRAILEAITQSTVQDTINVIDGYHAARNTVFFVSAVKRDNPHWFTK